MTGIDFAEDLSKAGGREIGLTAIQAPLNNNDNKLSLLYPVSEVMQPKDGMNGGMHELKFFIFPYGDS